MANSVRKLRAIQLEHNNVDLSIVGVKELEISSLIPDKIYIADEETHFCSKEVYSIQVYIQTEQRGRIGENKYKNINNISEMDFEILRDCGLNLSKLLLEVKIPVSQTVVPSSSSANILVDIVYKEKKREICLRG